MKTINIFNNFIIGMTIGISLNKNPPANQTEGLFTKQKKYKIMS